MAIQEEIRPVGAFSEVEVQGYGDIRLERLEPGDERSERLSITADEEILPKLKSEVRGSRLVISYDMAWYEWITSWLSWTSLANKTIRYTIRTEKLDALVLSGATNLKGDAFQGQACEISLSGSSKVQLDGLAVDTFRLKISGTGNVHIPRLEAGSTDLRVSGAGEVDLAGRSPRLNLNISGSGEIQAQALEAEQVDVTISGTGHCRLIARQDLTVHISGSGEVEYLGQPKVSQHISGSGKLKNLQGA